MDVTSMLTSLRSLVTEKLRTLIPRSDGPAPTLRTEGFQEVRDRLTTLQRQTTSNHTLHEDIRRLTVAAEDQPLHLF
jgi:hypothetical protein